MDKLIGKLAAILSDYFHIGDSYHYTLGRDKEAFGMGTMSLDDFTEYDEETIAELVDHLLANGVTIQRWIPVSERLPGEDDINEFGEVIVFDGREIRAAVYTPFHKRFFRHCFPFDGVTHWMPTPEPPKED